MALSAGIALRVFEYLARACARAGLMMSTPADWLMAVVLARQKSLG
jgi:hypothetical protein